MGKKKKREACTGPKSEIVTPEQLNTLFQEMTLKVYCEGQFITNLIGGQPADTKGLQAFVKHHLKLTDQEEIDAAVARIREEEIGDRDLPGQGELQEKITYGVNVLRRDKKGPWLGIWQIKANLKAAASRLGIFTSTIGTKGDLAECGRLRAEGDSCKNGAVDRVHLYHDNGSPVETYFEKIMGSVSSPKGRVSIVHDSEVAPLGCKFAFVLHLLPKRFSNDDLKKIFAMAGEIGLGSVKALERGKWQVKLLEIHR